MRTKTLLLSAAALLAAGFVSSQAQPVYSQNIVGYASVATPKASTSYLLTVPFVVGVSNGANEIWGSSLPDGTTVLIWVNYNHYVAYTWNTQDYPAPNAWEDSSQNNVPAPVLPVGQGFFLIPGAANLTNTFAGTVAINVGTSNVMALTNASTSYLVGSVVPYAGAITNGNSSTGGPNLNNLADGTTVLIWVNNNHYVAYTWNTQDYPAPNAWEDSSQNNVAPPTIAVGQGFFIIPGGSGYKWTTGL